MILSKETKRNYTMIELTLRFNDNNADIAYFATAMEDLYAWEINMRVMGGIVMNTEMDVMTALKALVDEGFDLDNDFENIEIKPL
jgi:hypothetical protein